MSFANYAAGAIMMPYGAFLRPASASLFDRPLCAEFGANVEQVAHRLRRWPAGRRAFPSSCYASTLPGTSQTLAE
jgi:predicted transcriptional regulator